jgi:phage tail-like protein
MYDIPVAFHFKVEIYSGPDGASPDDRDVRFQEVSGLTAEVTTEEYREGGLNQHAHRLPTGTKYGNLVLKRGFIDSSQVTAWCRRAIEGFELEPCDVRVILLDQAHQPLASWRFTGAYPVKWSISDLKAQESALVVESLELAFGSYFKE